MTNLERLRSRADNSGLSVETVVRGGSWFMSVDVQSPFAFVFLKACHESAVVAVPPQTISSVRLPEHPEYTKRFDGPSLVDIVVFGKPLYLAPDYAWPLT